MSVLTNISVYETAQKVYLVGEDREQEDCWRLLKIDRTNSPDDLTIVEDLTFYSRHQLQSVLRCLHDGNLSSGGLRKIAGPCPALIGACFSWTAAPYLLLVTRTRILGYINGHNAVYGIEATSLIPLGLPSGSDLPEPIAAEEARTRRLLSLVALTKDFFFSFSWPIWNTVQHNFSDSTLESPFSSDRVWNEHLTSKLRSALDGGGGGGQCKWVVPLVHGYFEQKKLYLLGRPLRLTLVARRSNRFAGTRYRKRGVTDNGEVANDVEIEQIVEVTEHVDSSLIPYSKMAPKMSSMVQVRGSVPLFWSQTWDTSTAAATAALRPTIRMLHHLDPLYTATRKHFDDLRRRYGNGTIHCVDLLRHGDSRQQESVLSAEYKNAIMFLNKRSQQCIGYVHWDLRRHAKKFGSSLLVDLQKVQTPLLANTGFFAIIASCTTLETRRQQNHLQHGIVRTNCVDCLDRTNVAQFTFGLLAIAHQLHSLGLVSSTTPSATVQPIDPGSSLAAELMAMYESMGHALAQQYGGSEAHTGFFKQQTTLQHSSGGGMGGDWQANLHLQGRDLLTSIKRFYSNAVTDEDKQAAINLFLGTFSPAVVAAENAKWTGWFQGRSAGASASQLNSGGGSAVNLHSNNLLLAPEPSLEDTAATTTSPSGTPLLPSSLSTASLASELDGGGDISLSLPEILSSAVVTSSNASSVAAGDGGEQRRRQLAEQQQQQRKTSRPPARIYSSPLLSSTSNAAGGLQSFDAMLNSRDVRHVSTTTARPAGPPTVQPPAFVSGPPAPTARLVRSNSTGNTPQLAVQQQQQQQRSLAGNANNNNNNNNNNNSRSARDLRGNLVILAPGETLSTHNNSYKNEKIDASVLPDGSSGYHALAGLNLEGGPELLPSLNSAPNQMRPSTAGNNQMSRAKRVSFASLSALRQFVRGGGDGGSGGGASDGGGSTKSGMSGYASRSTSALNLDTHSTNFSTTMAPAAPARAGSTGAATSSDFSYMFTQHHAVAHGLDDLGLPANIAPLYRRGSNIVSCFVELGKQAAEEHAKAMEKLAVPMDAAEHRASEREVAALLRPEVVVTLPEKACF